MRAVGTGGGLILSRTDACPFRSLLESLAKLASKPIDLSTVTAVITKIISTTRLAPVLLLRPGSRGNSAEKISLGSRPGHRRPVRNFSRHRGLKRGGIESGRVDTPSPRRRASRAGPTHHAGQQQAARGNSQAEHLLLDLSSHHRRATSRWRGRRRHRRADAVKTALPLALLAIMYAPPPNGIKWSIAVIRDTEIKSMGPYPVGGKIHGATVTEIQETRIYLDNAGKTEFLDLFEKPAPPAPPPAASAAGGTDPSRSRWTNGIKKTGENTFRDPARHAGVGAGQHVAALALGAHRARNARRQGRRLPPLRG